MPAIRITIDGKVEHDGHLDQWTQTTPDFIRNHITGGQLQEHWMIIMMIFSTAIKTGRDINIEATTGEQQTVTWKWTSS